MSLLFDFDEMLTHQPPTSDNLEQENRNLRAQVAELLTDRDKWRSRYEWLLNRLTDRANDTGLYELRHLANQARSPLDDTQETPRGGKHRRTVT